MHVPIIPTEICKGHFYSFQAVNLGNEHLSLRGRGVCVIFKKNIFNLEGKKYIQQEEGKTILLFGSIHFLKLGGEGIVRQKKKKNLMLIA